MRPPRTAGLQPVSQPGSQPPPHPQPTARRWAHRDGPGPHYQVPWVQGPLAVGGEGPPPSRGEGPPGRGSRRSGASRWEWGRAEAGRDGSGDSLTRGQAAPASRALPGLPAGGHSSSCLSHLNDTRACGTQGRAGLRPSVRVSVEWYPSEQVQAQKSGQRDRSHSFDKYNSHDHKVK